VRLIYVTVLAVSLEGYKRTPRVYEVRLTISGCVFKDTPCNALKATKPCAFTYACARIRRLVPLVPGLYRLPATAHQWSGLVARFPSRCIRTYQSGVRLPALDGGCAQGALGRAGLLGPRSTNLQTAATLTFSSKRVAASFEDLAYVQSYT